VILEEYEEKISLNKKLDLEAGDYNVTILYDDPSTGHFNMKVKSKSLLKYDNEKEHIIPEKGHKN